MADIGTNPRRVEVLPAKRPNRKPMPVPQPVKEPEKVPA